MQEDDRTSLPQVVIVGPDAPGVDIMTDLWVSR